jgi:choline kinase
LLYKERTKEMLEIMGKKILLKSMESLDLEPIAALYR